MPAALSDLEQRAVSALLDSDARESVLTMHDPSRHRVMLAVAGAVGFAAVFPSVGTKGAAEPTVLPHSVDHDSVLCLTTADVDWVCQLPCSVYVCMCVMLHSPTPTAGR